MRGIAAIEAALTEIGKLPADSIDLAEAALLLGALDKPSVDLAPYRAHLAVLVEAVAESIGTEAERIDARAQNINDVLYRRFGYGGDTESYDDPDNANLIRVIDRRVGLPVSLGILYIHLANAQGWPIAGLAFPGHFLVRLDFEARRLIVDPFHAGQPLEAGHLRDLLKQFQGAAAELGPKHYAAISNRDILLRLQNNLKARALQNSDPPRAATILKRMTMIAPDTPETWRELGMVEAHVGNIRHAMTALEKFLSLAPETKEAEKAAALLKRLKGSLN
ncbi:MAG: tetratricopeptide repeat protein [Alphaproteobacteria bacterium]|nr:tetratricopeptide repeat protein [Alphaproteobacteria bacterium]